MPALLPIVALGLSMLLYALSMMEAYELLVYNEEYTGKLSTRLLKRLRGIGRRHLACGPPASTKRRVRICWALSP